MHIALFLVQEKFAIVFMDLFCLIDIDECVINTENCTSHSTCVNTDGSFDCRCDAGYTGDGRIACTGMYIALFISVLITATVENGTI